MTEEKLESNLMAKLAADKFGGEIRLNLGCGGYHVPEFVNVDRDCPDADIQKDIRDLHFVDVDEVIMSHLLEHIPHVQTQGLLNRIYSWMNPGAPITIEVPDIAKMMDRNFDHWTEIGIYGVQTLEGEFHYSGWTLEKLIRQMTNAGFHITSARTFISAHPQRTGFPCIEAVGLRPLAHAVLDGMVIPE